MNRRAASESVVLWLVRIGATLVVIGIMVFLINGSIQKSLELEDLRFYPVAERLLYSDKCFVSVQDGRPYPGIIVASRFTQDYLDGCMKNSKFPLGIRTVLTYNNEQDEIYFNFENYDSFNPLVFDKKYMKVVKRYYVLVETTDHDLVPGNLLIDVVWRT